MLQGKVAGFLGTAHTNVEDAMPVMFSLDMLKLAPMFIGPGKVVLSRWFHSQLLAMPCRV